MGRIKSLTLQGKFVLRLDNTNEAGENVIMLQYTWDRKIAKRSTEVWLKASDWDGKGQKVKGTNVQHGRLNKKLQTMKTGIDAAILDFQAAKGRMSIADLRQIISGKTISQSVDFVSYVKEDIDIRYRTEKIGYSVFYNSNLYMDRFSDFLRNNYHKDTLLLSELTENVIDDYIIYRSSVRKNDNTTINKALTPIFKAAEKAANNGLIAYPLAKAIMTKYLPISGKLSQSDDDEEDEAKGVKYLTEEELRALIDMYSSFKYARTREFVDMFLFSFHACGLRFSDLLTLQWKHINAEKQELSKIAYKSGRRLTIPLTDAAMILLGNWEKKRLNSRFVFDLLKEDFDLKDEAELNRQRLNKSRALRTSLNEIGLKMGLEFNLGIHVARHTFAVMALNKQKVSLHIISQLLGHASILVTEKVYAKFLPKTIEDEVKQKLSFPSLIPSSR